MYLINDGYGEGETESAYNTKRRGNTYDGDYGGDYGGCMTPTEVRIERELQQKYQRAANTRRAANTWTAGAGDERPPLSQPEYSQPEYSQPEQMQSQSSDAIVTKLDEAASQASQQLQGLRVTLKRVKALQATRLQRQHDMESSFREGGDEEGEDELVQEELVQEMLAGVGACVHANGGTNGDGVLSASALPLEWSPEWRRELSRELLRAKASASAQRLSLRVHEKQRQRREHREQAARAHYAAQEGQQQIAQEAGMDRLHAIEALALERTTAEQRIIRKQADEISHLKELCQRLLADELDGELGGRKRTGGGRGQREFAMECPIC
jgi:hypothetical protein